MGSRCVVGVVVCGSSIDFWFQVFAEALMVIPKILAQNSGLDPQDSIVKLQVCYGACDRHVTGV